jgi:hypothetical protein
MAFSHALICRGGRCVNDGPVRIECPHQTSFMARYIGLQALESVFGYKE